jgi:Alpha/beta hydrolase domain
MTYIVLRLVAVASACLWLASGEQIAHATTTAANVDSTRLVRPGGTRYRYVEGSLNGTTARDDGSTGSYSVGFVLYYPTESGQVNGAGVVDYPNSVYYPVIHPLCGGAPGGIPSVQREEFTFQFTLATTEDYLFKEGYTHMSIQWNKVVTDLFGAKVPNDGLAHNRLCFGTIERGSDAWEIMRDAGRFLKSPTLTGLPAGANQPMAVGAVIGAGYSQTGALANEFMIRGENNNGGGPRPFDAFLVQFMGAVCWQRTDSGPFYGGGVACPRVPTDADRGGAVGNSTGALESVDRRPLFIKLGKDFGVDGIALNHAVKVTELLSPLWQLCAFGYVMEWKQQQKKLSACGPSHTHERTPSRLAIALLFTVRMNKRTNRSACMNRPIPPRFGQEHGGAARPAARWPLPCGQNPTDRC